MADHDNSAQRRIRELHDGEYGADEPETTLPYLLADVFHVIAAAGLDVDRTIEDARRTVAGDREHADLMGEA